MASYTIYVHGTGTMTGGTRTSNYTGSPNISATLTIDDATRSGSTVKIPVKISVGACNGSSYFGYTMKLYARIGTDEDTQKTLVSKDASPSQWSSGKYSGSATLSTSTSNTSVTISIYMKSNCTCSQKNTTVRVWYITTSVPAATATVTFNPNGGNWSGSTSNKKVTVDIGSSASTSNPTRSGYTFKNWNTKSGGSGTSYSGSITNVQSDMTVYAQWTANTRTITYNANGGTGAPSSATVNDSSSYTISSTKPTGQTFTISFDANGGTVSPDTKTVQQTFKNWNTAANGSGTSYSSGGTIKSVTSDITLYAQYTNPTAGELPVAERYNDVTEENDESIGWSTSKTGGSGTYISSSTTITGNTVVYAQYGIYITYYYNTDAFNEETSGETTVMQYINSTYAITLYSGWSIEIPDELNGKYVITQDSSGNQIYTFTFDEEDEYIVTVYNASGTIETTYDFIIVDSDDDLEHWGDLGVFAVEEKEYGKDYTIMSDYPIVPKLEFDHWNTQSDDKGTTYKAGDIYSTDETMDLYAQYNPGKYTVTFDANGGSFASGTVDSKGGTLTNNNTKIVYYNVTAGNSAGPPTDSSGNEIVPTRKQHSFLGWMGNYWEVTQDTTIKAMWTYYPIWIQNSKHEWEGFR